jgi:hypothetical protein
MENAEMHQHTDRNAQAANKKCFTSLKYVEGSAKGRKHTEPPSRPNTILGAEMPPKRMPLRTDWGPIAELARRRPIDGVNTGDWNARQAATADMPIRTDNNFIA